MNRLLIVIAILLLGTGALIYGDAERIAYAQKTVAATATDVTAALAHAFAIEPARGRHSAQERRRVRGPRQDQQRRRRRWWSIPARPRSC